MQVLSDVEPADDRPVQRQSSNILESESSPEEKSANAASSPHAARPFADSSNANSLTTKALSDEVIDCDIDEVILTPEGLALGSSSQTLQSEEKPAACRSFIDPLLQ